MRNSSETGGNYRSWRVRSDDPEAWECGFLATIDAYMEGHPLRRRVSRLAYGEQFLSRDRQRGPVKDNLDGQSRKLANPRRIIREGNDGDLPGRPVPLAAGES